MAKDIGRLIGIYVAFWFLGLAAQGCKSTHTTEQYNHVGTEQITRTDSTTQETTAQGILAAIDTSRVEVLYTITTYDTERTDTDGAHPIKSVGVLRATTRRGVSFNDSITRTDKATATRHEDIAVSDSTAAQRDKVARRSWVTPLRLGAVVGVLLAAVLFVLYKKIRPTFGR